MKFRGWPGLRVLSSAAAPRPLLLHSVTSTCSLTCDQVDPCDGPFDGDSSGEDMSQAEPGGVHACAGMSM